MRVFKPPTAGGYDTLRGAFIALSWANALDVGRPVAIERVSALECFVGRKQLAF
jgi:hypothetical protein